MAILISLNVVIQIINFQKAQLLSKNRPTILKTRKLEIEGTFSSSKHHVTINLVYLCDLQISVVEHFSVELINSGFGYRCLKCFKYELSM